VIKKQIIFICELFFVCFSENIYDQIPSETYYDAPYEMRSNDEMYEPEPNNRPNITINGINVR
jgi:hypothetical protein